MKARVMTLKLQGLNLHHLFFLLMLFCMSIGTARSATTYYVSTSGSDGNPGTLSAPFRNINTAVKKLAAGDTLLIRGGTYREEVNILTGGGSAGNYVTIAAYSGEKPILKGSDVVTGWVQHSGSIWKKTGWGQNSQQVFVDFD